MHKTPAAKPKDQQVSDDEIIELEQSDVARYIFNMCYELAIMAEKANMPMLWYLLRLASAEANTKFRDSNVLSH